MMCGAFAAARSDALHGESHAAGRPEACWDLFGAAEAETLVKADRLGIGDDLDPIRSVLARDPHRVVDQRAPHPGSHVSGLDEQAIEFAGAARRREQHGEANDVCLQFGDSHETILDPVDGELDRIAMGEELLAVHVPVHRRAALQLGEEALLGRAGVTDQDGRVLSHGANHYRLSRRGGGRASH
jgi:hypothetical protein